MTIKFWVLIDLDELRDGADSPVSRIMQGILVADDVLGQFFQLRERLLLLISQLGICAG